MTITTFLANLGLAFKDNNHSTRFDSMGALIVTDIRTGITMNVGEDRSSTFYSIEGVKFTTPDSERNIKDRDVNKVYALLYKRLTDITAGEDVLHQMLDRVIPEELLFDSVNGNYELRKCVINIATGEKPEDNTLMILPKVSTAYGGITVPLPTTNMIQAVNMIDALYKVINKFDS